MRMGRSLAIGLIGVVALSGMSGCSAMRERRWGWCAVGGGLLGAAIGGGTAGGLASAYEKRGNPGDKDSGQIAGIGLAGAGGGALLGTLLGHMICDPEEEAPPPAPAAAPPPPPPARKPIVTLHGPQFDFDKATLKPDGKKLVDEAVRVMRDSPSMNVSVEGHTDSIGTDAYNQRLSERRAKSVRDYMVAEGISASRIKTEGFGKTKPIADNKTAAGRAENRRVEILPD